MATFYAQNSCLFWGLNFLICKIKGIDQVNFSVFPSLKFDIPVKF